MRGRALFQQVLSPGSPDPRRGSPGECLAHGFSLRGSAKRKEAVVVEEDGRNAEEMVFY